MFSGLLSFRNTPPVHVTRLGIPQAQNRHTKIRIPKRTALKGASQSNGRAEVVQKPALTRHPEKMPQRRAVIPVNIFQGSVHLLSKVIILREVVWHGSL